MFCTKSAESLENKRVEFLIGAKNDKRVRKSLKTKRMNQDRRNVQTLGRTLPPSQRAQKCLELIEKKEREGQEMVF